MGQLGTPVWCYEWVVVLNWVRADKAFVSHGGALVTGYDHRKMIGAPLTEHGSVIEDELWNRLSCFLEQVGPVAEEANIKLAMHPDDPPLSPIGG